MAEVSLESFGYCKKCDDMIVGNETGCSAMGEIYHIECFCCAACNEPLRGRQFYSVNDEPYCEEDYLETLEKCKACRKPIEERILTANSLKYHPECFRCEVCNKILDDVPFTLAPDGKVHCIEDYHEKYAPRCSACNGLIVPEDNERETVRIVALERNFHISCYKCEDCELLLSSEAEGRGCFPFDGHILCRDCHKGRLKAQVNTSTSFTRNATGNMESKSFEDLNENDDHDLNNHKHDDYNDDDDDDFYD